MPKKNPKHESAAARYYKRSQVVRGQDKGKDRTPLYFGLLFIGIITAVVIVGVVLTRDPSRKVVVKKDDTVTIEYTGWLDNNSIFDDDTIVDHVVGGPGLLEYFDQQLVGAVAGEKKEFTIPSEYGYTDPGYDLYGENLNFQIEIVEVIRDGEVLYPR
ncbi:hypothetical protein GF325_18460 [Candidatus Bathyarchaeota archaeon]|nr:hypothetical protein [Candidatus Bathyarchaeota archaeon]